MERRGDRGEDVMQISHKQLHTTAQAHKKVYLESGLMGIEINSMACVVLGGFSTTSPFVL